MPEPRGGMTDDEILIRILVATQEAVKNLEQLNSHFNKFNASASKAKTGASQFGEAANKATSDTVSGAKAAGAGMDDLSKKIKNGTASMKEYSQAVRAGLVIPPATIKSLESISAMGSKSQWIPNVGAVRTAMEQIMQSVNVNSTKAGQILRNTFHNIPVQAIQTAERQINQSMMGIRGIVNNIFSDLKAAVQTFFGVTMAMMVFNAAKLVSDFFKSSIQAAKDFERETRELNLAEAILSRAGVDIVKKELDDLVDHLYSTYNKMLPKAEFQSITSEVAIMARDFGLAKEEIFKLVEVIAYLQVQNRLAGKEDIRASQLVDAIFDRRTRALSTYGIDVSEKALERVAIKNGLIEEGEALDDNTKRLAAIQSAYDATVGYQEEFLQSIDGTREQMVLLNQELLHVIKIDVGNWFLDMEFTALKALGTLRQLVDVWDDIFSRSEGQETDGRQSNVMAFLSVLNPLKLIHISILMIGTAIGTVVAGTTLFFDTLTRGESVWMAFSKAGQAASATIKQGLAEILDVMIPHVDSGLSEAMKGVSKWAWGIDIDEKRKGKEMQGEDTPTGERWESGDIDGEVSKLEDALKKMNDAILEAQLRLEQDMEEASIKLGRKMVDIDREYLKKREEAYLDFTKKIRDINASFDEKIRDIRQSSNESAQKFRNDELKREEDFQNKMKELKEKFLMDMDEALHARDARQVLRLIKQYNLDKTQLERRHELDKKQARREEEERQKKFKQEIADAERQRQLKLLQAEIEYQDKLEKLKREEEAEREAAKIAYQREIDDLHRKMHDRLELIAAGLVNEFNLTKDGLDAITELYKRYYENVRQIYESMNHMLSGRQNLTAPPTPTRKGGGGGGRVKGMAKGGALLANRPTNVVFGEAGAELATFIPLSKMGSGLSSMFGGLGGGEGGSNGGLQIDVTLSPDLEARIVNNTLNKASNIIAKVQREKRQ